MPLMLDVKDRKSARFCQKMIIFGSCVAPWRQAITRARDADVSPEHHVHGAINLNDHASSYVLRMLKSCAGWKGFLLFLAGCVIVPFLVGWQCLNRQVLTSSGIGPDRPNSATRGKTKMSVPCVSVVKCFWFRLCRAVIIEKKY